MKNYNKPFKLAIDEYIGTSPLVKKEDKEQFFKQIHSPNVSKRKSHWIPLFLTAVLFIGLIGGVYAAFESGLLQNANEQTAREKGISKIEHVVRNTFTGPNEDFLEVMEQEGSHITALDEYYAKFFKPYFTEDGYIRFVSTNGLEFINFAAEGGYTMKVNQVEIQNVSTENEIIYNFTAEVQFQKGNSELRTAVISGQANVDEEGKIKDFEIRNSDGLQELIRMRPSASEKIISQYPEEVRKEFERLPEEFRKQIAVPLNLPETFVPISFQFTSEPINDPNGNIILTNFIYADEEAGCQLLLTTWYGNTEAANERQYETITLINGIEAKVKGDYSLEWEDHNGHLQQLSFIAVPENKNFPYTIDDLIEFANFME